MTGKTSLATLVSRAVVNKYRQEKKKAAVFNFSTLGISEDMTFEDIFKWRCKVTWEYAKGKLPARDCVVYMVLDETQIIYKAATTSHRHTYRVLGELVKRVLNDAAYNVRILLFAAYDSGVEYSGLATPVHFGERMVFGIKELNFSQAEVSEYVAKWFKGISCFEGSSSSMMEVFCANLEELTGGHVGLCSSAIHIHALNGVYCFRRGSASDRLSADAWVGMLQSGSLYQPDDAALFEALVSTCAVKGLETLTIEELDRLELIAYGANRSVDTAIVDKCVRMGILAQSEQRIDFSSPVILCQDTCEAYRPSTSCSENPSLRDDRSSDATDRL